MLFRVYWWVHSENPFLLQIAAKFNIFVIRKNLSSTSRLLGRDACGPPSRFAILSLEDPPDLHPHGIVRSSSSSILNFPLIFMTKRVFGVDSLINRFLIAVLFFTIVRSVMWINQNRRGNLILLNILANIRVDVILNRLHWYCQRGFCQ